MATTPVPTKIDINDILSQFAYQGTVEQVQNEQLQGIEQSFNTSSDAQVEAIKKEALLTGEMQAVVDQIMLNRAKKNQDAAAFFGVNQEASNSILQEMSASLLEQHTRLQQSGQQILERQQRDFSDDPINWLVDQFTLPADIAAHNTGIAIMERDFEVLAKLGALADSQIARNNAIDANTNTALTRLAADRALAAAEIKAQTARQEALKLGVQLGSIRLATSQQAFSNMLAVHGAHVSLQHLQLSKQNKEHNDDMKELQKKHLQLLIDKKEEDAKAKEELQSNLDRATAALGMRRITVNEFDRAPQSLKLALFDVMSSPSTMQGRLGYDTVDAIETAQALNAPLTPQLQQIKNIITSWTATLSAQPTWAALKPAEKHSKAQQFILEKVRIEAGNIPDSGGLYSAPSLLSVGKIPAVAATKLWKETFAAMAAANPQLPTSAQGMYDAAAAAVVAGRMTPEQAAAEISTIYRAIVVDNSQQRDYNRFALPMQNEYRTAVDTGEGIFRSKSIIDMTNPTHIQRQLMRMAAQQKAFTAPNPLSSPPLRPLMPPTTGNEGQQ